MSTANSTVIHETHMRMICVKVLRGHYNSPHESGVTQPLDTPEDASPPKRNTRAASRTNVPLQP